MLPALLIEEPRVLPGAAEGDGTREDRTSFADLLRLIQVAPVEVVSLCDVDSVMLADAAAQVASRQISKKSPRTYRDYREMLKEKDFVFAQAAASKFDGVLLETPALTACRLRQGPKFER
mgnify:CR=1 FL=1